MSRLITAVLRALNYCTCGCPQGDHWLGYGKCVNRGRCGCTAYDGPED